VLHVRVLPFAENLDNWLQGVALTALCIIYFCGLVIKVGSRVQPACIGLVLIYFWRRLSGPKPVSHTIRCFKHPRWLLLFCWRLFQFFSRYVLAVVGADM
jgi:hypothetical protein